MMANDLAPPCLASTSLSAAAAKGFCIASQPASQPAIGYLTIRCIALCV
jgi:hypothetical protein